MGFKPKYLLLHDYGGKPKNQDGMFNPYHALVFPDGSIRYRDEKNPYGAKAPHAYKLNPQAIGLSYAGDVGSEPTPEAMRTLQSEYDKINKMFPGLRTLGHGEAFAETKDTDHRASKDGRDLIEASWRKNLRNGPAQPPTVLAGAALQPNQQASIHQSGFGRRSRPGPQPEMPFDIAGATHQPMQQPMPASVRNPIQAAPQPGPFQVATNTPPPIKPPASGLDFKGFGGIFSGSPGSASSGGFGGGFGNALSGILSSLGGGGQQKEEQPVDTSLMQQVMADEEARRKKALQSPFIMGMG